MSANDGGNDDKQENIGMAVAVDSMRRLALFGQKGKQPKDPPPRPIQPALGKYASGRQMPIEANLEFVTRADARAGLGYNPDWEVYKKGQLLVVAGGDVIVNPSDYFKKSSDTYRFKYGDRILNSDNKRDRMARLLLGDMAESWGKAPVTFTRAISGVGQTRKAKSKKQVIRERWTKFTATASRLDEKMAVVKAGAKAIGRWGTQTPSGVEPPEDEAVKAAAIEAGKLYNEVITIGDAILNAHYPEGEAYNAINEAKKILDEHADAFAEFLDNCEGFLFPQH